MNYIPRQIRCGKHNQPVETPLGGGGGAVAFQWGVDGPCGDACVGTVVAQQHATVRGVLAALPQRWSLYHRYRQSSHGDTLQHGRRTTKIAQSGFHDRSVPSALLVRVARRVDQTVRFVRAGDPESSLARRITKTASALDLACDNLRSFRMHAKVTGSSDGVLPSVVYASTCTPYLWCIGQGQRAC